MFDALQLLGGIITVDGKLYAGGIEGVVNEFEGNEIKNFDIRAFSLTSE